MTQTSFIVHRSSFIVQKARAPLLLVLVLAVIPLSSLMALPTLTWPRPPRGREHLEDISWLVIHNPDRDTYRNVYLWAEIVSGNGTLVVEDSTHDFNVLPGTTNLTAPFLKSTGAYTPRYSPDYLSFALRAGSLPSGTYTFTVTLKPLGVTRLYEINFEPPGPPRLISPRDGDSVSVEYPPFVWTSPTPPDTSFTYELTIAEVLPGQTREEALSANQPWFEQAGLAGTNLTYPVAAKALENGKTYAWQVLAQAARQTIVSSDVRLFTLSESLRVSLHAGDSLVSVIVLLNERTSAALLSRLQGTIGPFKVKYVYDIIPGFAATMSKRQRTALAKDPSVKRIGLDSRCHALRYTDQDWFGTNPARSDFGVSGNLDGDSTRYTTGDIVMAILDSGTDPNHKDLAGKIIGWKDLVNNSATPHDDCGHGTECASIALGTGHANAAGRGVAPGAALVSVKVLDSTGGCLSSTAIEGIEWIVKNKASYNIRVLSISLGVTRNSDNADGQDALSAACNSAVDAGMVVCVAAGNDGPNAGTIDSPGAADEVVTVGAMGDCGEGDFFLDSLSSRGPTADGRIKPDICAPGDNLTAARRGTIDQYCIVSGTSFATPFVAGTVALMLSANRKLTPVQVKSKLMSTAQDWGPPGPDNDYGAGRLQGYDAVELASGRWGTSPCVPSHRLLTGKLDSTGAQDDWKIDVTSPGLPFVATLIVPGWTSASGPSVEITIRDHSGKEVANTSSVMRQAIVSYTPFAAGPYSLAIKSKSGAGAYFCDLCGLISPGP